jgi:class 3 adenylate cyclase/putative methionine-R-sulfoxide reductase with GAF domain
MKMQVSLKRLVAKKEIRQVIKHLMQVIETPIAIQDREGICLLGDSLLEYSVRCSIALEGEEIGAVVGLRKVEAIATFLSYAAQQELERKELARETLEKYKEINLLYNTAERLSANLELQDITKVIIEEARKLIKATSYSVMLLDIPTQRLKIVSYLAKNPEPQFSFRLGEGIAGHVAQTGRAEIVNDVSLDPRYIAGPNPVTSLICAPIKMKDSILGAINVSSTDPQQYTAADLKLIQTLASQAAVAIENAILHEQKLTEARIKGNLERYLSSQVVEAIWESKGNISLNPTKRSIAILFSDIRDFTTKCEELNPEILVEYLNEYLTQMVDVIFDYQGTVNKFVGDMIVALFGAPETMLDAEAKAIATAIDMQRRIDMISIPWIRENFRTGIGINTGPAIVGNIGSPRHMDYTAIGDEVNIASRLQSLAKGGQILVSRRVYDATEHLFEFREVGATQVKGKKQPIEVFEVLYS